MKAEQLDRNANYSTLVKVCKFTIVNVQNEPTILQTDSSVYNYTGFQSFFCSQ
jgi:hypothetical protein